LAKYGTPVFYIEPRGTLFLRVYTVEPFRGSKYVALIEPFKVLYGTFSSKSVFMTCHDYEGVMSVLCTPLQVKFYQIWKDVLFC